jgi:hypothetical protein
LQVKKRNKHVGALREIDEENTANFQLALQNKNLEQVYKQENLNRKFNIFHNIFLLIFENSFPLVVKKEDRHQ